MACMLVPRAAAAAGVVAVLACCALGGAGALPVLPPDLDFPDSSWAVGDIADLTPGASVAAYPSVAFGVSLLGFQGLAFSELNRTALMLALFNAVPGAGPRVIKADRFSPTNSSFTFVRHGRVTVRGIATYTGPASATDALALLDLLTRPPRLQAALDAAGLGAWRPNLEYATLPFLTNSSGGGAGVRILLGRQLGLHFTLKLSGMSLFLGFDLDFERKLLAHIRKTVATYPATIEFRPTEETIVVANRTTTNVHLHMLITQTGYDSMLAFINKIRTSPASVFTPALFGTTVITVEPWSAKLTLVPNPVALLPPPETKWNPKTRARAERLTLYSRAIRCKWPRVSSWTCAACAIPGARLQHAWVSDPDYEDAKDAFTIHWDVLLNATVVTFRSTYGNAAGWSNAAKLELVGQTIASRAYQMHKGFSSSFYNTFGDGHNSAIKPALLQRLKQALAANRPASPFLYFVGHSRGGAMATIAAADAVVASRDELGIRHSWHTVKLYTFGQPRVGDRAHAEIIEEYIGERFRILNNADPAGSMPPSQVDLDNDLSLVNVLAAQAVSAATSGEPLLTSVGAWAAIKSVLGFGYGLKPFQPTFDLRAELRKRAAPYAKTYRHWGPLVLTLDYTRAASGGGTQRVVSTIVCPTDNDPACRDGQLGAIELGQSPKLSKRPASEAYTFGWMAGFLGRPEKWPLVSVLDHGYYLGTDVGNERCVAMKPPGWAGWKLTLATTDSYYLPDGTDGQVSAGWTCAAPPRQPWGTAGQLGLHCGLGAGDVVGQDFDDINCFEIGDRDMFAWQYWEPGRDDTFMTDPVPVCAAPGARLNVSVRLVKDFGGALGPDDWYMDGVWLTLSRVPPDSRTDQVVTQTFGRCPESPLLAAPPKFVFGQTRYFSLCADAPWWKWVLSVRTAADAGAGTDADIRLAGLTCGAFAGLGSPVSLTARCNARLDEAAPCFEYGATNTFHLEHAPGNLIAAREVFQAAHYPLPACLGASQPVLRLGFRGAAASDAWIQDQGALRLELHYIPPDQTYSWEDTSGNQLDVIRVRRFKPCAALGHKTWAVQADWQYQNIAMCAY